MTPVAALIHFNQTNTIEFHAHVINVKCIAAEERSILMYIDHETSSCSTHFCQPRILCT